jgi:hypothetical protein
MPRGLVLARQPPNRLWQGRKKPEARLGSAAVHNQRAARFTMAQGRRECELAMTQVLQFYDNSDVCRIF